MINQLEHAISAFAQLAVVCTFGLALAIGIAGVTHSSMPLKCMDCSATLAVATDTSTHRI